ncbi:MAG: metal-dependent hydrolase [Oleispira sp.]|nr:metal-dependent hydrolase [Oleispira sp.]MBL4881242.1 metal-dependent hydrolase [Oleispira sp.]
MTKPIDGAIKPRRMQFNTDDMKMAQFAIENNSLISTFFYSLSAMFPEGERFFIHAVRHYQKSISDPKMLADIRGFIGQEAHHGRCHDDLNDQIEKLGIPMSMISNNMAARVEMLKRRFGPERQLALTVAMEHFTASLAEFLLANPEVLDQAPEAFRHMMLWHSVEEIEHKAVAFDVYRLQVDNEWMRRRVMVIAMVSLFSRIAFFQVRILWKTKHMPSFTEWRQAAKFFWGKKGMLRANAGGVKKFFQRGFHPNDIDQSALIDGWEERFPEVAAQQV